MWRFTLATSTSAFPLAARSPTQITGCSEAVRGFDTFRFRVRAVEGDALAVLTREAVPHALVSVETAPPARRKLLVKAV